MSTVPLATAQGGFYTGTWNAPANPTAIPRSYAVSVMASNGPGAVTDVPAGTVVVDGLSSGMLSVTPTSLVFNAVKLGKHVNRTLKLKNVGTGPLRIKIDGPFLSLGRLAFVMTLPPNSGVTTVNGSRWLTLAPQKNVTATVTFTPGSTVTVADQFTIQNNGATPTSVNVPVSGSGK